MESEYLDRIPWERQYYIDIIIPHSQVRNIKCVMCGESFLAEDTQIPSHISHLNEVHRITELTHHAEREFFIENFIIDTVKSTAVCRICHKRRHFKKKEIPYSQYGLYLLRNHIEIYHKKYLQNYELITRTFDGRQTLNKYFIMGNEAACPKCYRKIDMTHSKTQPAEKVKELLEHYFSHRYKEKCFIFATHRKIDFVLFVLFQ